MADFNIKVDPALEKYVGQAERRAEQERVTDEKIKALCVSGEIKDKDYCLKKFGVVAPASNGRGLGE